MGWGRMLLLGDIGQQLDLQDQKAELERMRREMQAEGLNPQTSGARLERLEEANDELRLYLAAVVRLLVTKGVVSRNEVLDVVQAVDAEDGAADGRFDGSMT
ncbi:MAG: hypothetical protein R6X20_07990 [Phycisphaerae bacterium]